MSKIPILVCKHDIQLCQGKDFNDNRILYLHLFGIEVSDNIFECDVSKECVYRIINLLHNKINNND